MIHAAAKNINHPWYNKDSESMRYFIPTMAIIDPPPPSLQKLPTLQKQYSPWTLRSLPRRLDNQNTSLDVATDHGLARRTEALIDLALGDVAALMQFSSVASS